jgi:hypothetical protein
MGYPTKVQIIKRTGSEQWYVNFPAVLAKAMEFEKGETVEWIVEDKGLLVLRRMKVPGSALKKKLMTTSSNNSKDSSRKGATPSPKIVFSTGPKDSR